MQVQLYNFLWPWRVTENPTVGYKLDSTVLWRKDQSLLSIDWFSW